MLTTGRDAAGAWRMWRVGRRRLALRPRYHPWGVDADDGHGILLLLNLAPLVVYGLSWIVALTATVVVWPWRALTGRWPVVAYLPDPDGDDGLRCAEVKGRANADALARRWLLDIKRRGEPQAPPVRGAAATRAGGSTA